MSTENVLREIAVERQRQLEVHGWTQEHDDRHSYHEWGWLLSKRAVELSCPFTDAVLDPRRQLIEAAAIAVAAVESFDRTREDRCPRCGSLDTFCDRVSVPDVTDDPNNPPTMRGTLHCYACDRRAAQL